MKIKGKCVSYDVDKQGEKFDKDGIELPKVGSSIVYDFVMSNPENILGKITNSENKEDGVYVEGILFDKHPKVKAIEKIKDELGLAVGGKILERDIDNPKIIKKCKIDYVSIIPMDKSVDPSCRILEIVDSKEENNGS